MSELTRRNALRSYARMMNTFSVEHIKPLLADDFRYASQWVIDEIESPAAYLEYITAKLENLRASKTEVWAEMAKCPEDCVVMAQGNRDNSVATVLATVEGVKLRRLDMCCVPAPESAERSGEFPK